MSRYGAFGKNRSHRTPSTTVAHAGAASRAPGTRRARKRTGPTPGRGSRRGSGRSRCRCDGRGTTTVTTQSADAASRAGIVSARRSSIRPDGADVAERVVDCVAGSKIFTTSPVCGAWMKLPPPMYIPTWPARSDRDGENTRSPGRGPRRAGFASLVPLRAAEVRQVDPELRVHVHHEARAVEAGERARAAPDVRDAEVTLGDRHGAGSGPALSGRSGVVASDGPPTVASGARPNRSHEEPRREPPARQLRPARARRGSDGRRRRRGRRPGRGRCRGGRAARPPARTRRSCRPRSAGRCSARPSRSGLDHEPVDARALGAGRGTNMRPMRMRPPRMLTSSSIRPPASRSDEPIVSA